MRMMTGGFRKWGCSQGDFLLLLPVLALTVGLKYHSSKALSEELAWMLAPLAGLVELLSGLSFHLESGAGYVSSDRRIIIAPVCAGINFLITSLLAGAATVLMSSASLAGKMQRLAGITGSAYLLTLLVNGLRVTLAIKLYGLDIYEGWLTPERLHRLVGIFLYFPALLAYSLVLQKLFTKNNPWQVVWLCLFCYLGMVLGVPLVTGSFLEAGARFYEHGLTVLIGCGVIGGVYLFFCLAWKKNLNP